MKMIPYGRQEVLDADIELVVGVLKSDYLTQGPMVPAFEDVVSKHVGSSYAIAVNSATSALHIACLSLGLGHGDYLWTSPISFVASANCALYCGAKIDFVDINPVTYNLCPEALRAKLEIAELKGRLPKIVVPVHMCGQPCDMEAINKLAVRYGFKIIEDASHAIGGKYAGDFIGSGKYSDITVFSFHPVKIITTGEGGMALTNSPELAEKMVLLRSHGITRDSAKMLQKPEGSWCYEQVALGFNYRLTDLQAALGLGQMGRLDSYVSQRNYLAESYGDMLSDLPLDLPVIINNAYSSYHLYVVALKLEDIAATRREVFDLMMLHGIGVSIHYIPIHLQPYYQQMGFKVGDFPNSEAYYKRALTLPLYPNLSNAEQARVVEVLGQALIK
jgi:UDP-4-amino-4,6-dideoxy-N-acetyl-beta-L-altrosamine transaminase